MMIASQFSLPITFDLFFCLCSIHIDLSAQFKQRIKHESLLNRCYQYKHTFTISNAKTIFFCLFWAGCIVRLIETLKTQFSIILETRQLFFSFLFFFSCLPWPSTPRGSESGRSTPSLSTYSDGKSPSSTYVAAPRHFHIPGRC